MFSFLQFDGEKRAFDGKGYPMDRRAVLKIGATGLTYLTLPSLGQPTLAPVKLLLVRRPGLSPTNQCVAPCIRGALYDVSNIDAPLNELTMPALIGRVPLCDVIERSWQNNTANKSSILRGVYPEIVRTDARRPWMNSETRRWRLELQNNGHRTNIQFHYGQDVSWSQGCFIVGTALQSGEAEGVTKRYCSVENGEAAIAAIRAAVSAVGRNANIAVGVSDDGGLFANLTPTPPC